MNLERAVATLTGEYHALFMFAQVVAMNHPDPNALLAEMNVSEQLGLSAIESTTVPDATIVGFQETLAGILRALSANSRCNRNSPDPSKL